MSEKNRKNDQKSTIKLAFVVDFWYNEKIYMYRKRYGGTYGV